MQMMLKVFQVAFWEASPSSRQLWWTTGLPKKAVDNGGPMCYFFSIVLEFQQETIGGWHWRD
jgi:hypothetical protein